MDLVTPHWPAPANVRAVCSTREGGVSTGNYASLNLGDHVGDEPALVERNRAIFERQLGARPVYLKQVHGTACLAIDGTTEDAPEADACVASVRGVACTIMVADCLPILFTTEDGSRVGAAHAGWRGLASGIVESTVKAMQSGNLIAWLGPCIGPEAFEVGEDVKAAFGNVAAEHFKPRGEGKWLADLPALTRMRLHDAGVARIHGNDGTREWCTVANPSRFFSHRRDRVSGRFAAAIWRR